MKIISLYSLVLSVSALANDVISDKVINFAEGAARYELWRVSQRDAELQYNISLDEFTLKVRKRKLVQLTVIEFCWRINDNVKHKLPNNEMYVYMTDPIGTPHVILEWKPLKFFEDWDDNLEK
jgi:hypothetical protein